MLPRGLRNNNPGNIRKSADLWAGEVCPSTDAEFCQFQTMAHGYRAMFVILNNYQRRHGLTTLRQMISRWAPPEDNNHTEAYIAAVCRETGIDPDSRITTTNRDVMIPVVSAMSRVENGCPADYAEVQKGWNLFQQSRR